MTRHSRSEQSFDQGLAERVRALLKHRGDVTERRMFGGLAFLLDGHMCAGVDRADLIVRVPPAHHARYLAHHDAREFTLGGRSSMKGWLLVSRDGTGTTAALRRWVDVSVAHAASLPPKVRGHAHGREPMAGRPVPLRKKR